MRPPLRIAVYGPESTGKTQLAEKLARYFGAPLVTEYAREFWDRYGAITLADIPNIAGEQWRREDAAVLASTGPLVICDTDALTTVLWSDWLYGTCPDDVRQEANRRAMQYDFYLFLDIDVPFVADSQRCFPDPVDRQKGREMWLGALVQRGRPHRLITGNWAEREARAIEAVAERLARV